MSARTTGAAAGARISGSGPTAFARKARQATDRTQAAPLAPGPSRKAGTARRAAVAKTAAACAYCPPSSILPGPEANEIQAAP
ncbi:MAG TPA: hypothetical protein DIC34_18305 [Treponema sp.]|nr:hypothetical protein [Treponema sp.]